MTTGFGRTGFGRFGTQRYLTREEWDRSTVGNLPQDVQGMIWMHMQDTHLNGPKLRLRFLGEVVIIENEPNEPLYEADVSDFHSLIRQLEEKKEKQDNQAVRSGAPRFEIATTTTSADDPRRLSLYLRSHGRFDLLALLKSLGHQVFPGGDDPRSAYLQLRFPQPEAYWNNFGGFTGPENFVSRINTMM